MSETEPTTSRAAQAANLFDLRRIIGGVFVALGLLLTILGLTESQAEIDKAAGVNINLWVGVAMLITAAIFLVWAFSRPLGEEIVGDERPEGDRTVPGATAPTGPDAAALGGSKTTRRRPRSDRD